MDPLSKLTPVALTELLRRFGVLGESAVVDVETERIGSDLGFNGVLCRVIPTYDHTERQAPTSLIAKMPQSSSVAMKLEQEARFYREFVGGIGIRIPRAFVAEPELLLLEDLWPLRCGDAAAGCSVEEARMIIRHLARFHAFGWEQPTITRHEWLPRWPVSPEQFHARFREYHRVFFERFTEQINDAMRDLTCRLVESIPRVVEQLGRAPRTLIHVDTHLDNLLFELPDTVVLIDWPSAATGPSAVDLSRFLTNSLSAPVRRSVENTLAAYYLDVLRDEGDSTYSHDELWLHVKLVALRSWAGMVTGFGASNPDRLQERQAALQRIEIDRMSAAASDWGLSVFLDSLD